ncbi:DUF4114 domain-containing protein [Plectonema cf. radiosum LEGE 06105]|uniref:DUF4114 domain-containing protein n=1 Tax=Plectonema cf. radiosum LEGE 06105 TaxID=945769 RepID=A0A8J7EZL6_9CYAN|nr:DUF4114 domain-containing protein [Plectonema radiosum]MBE9213126.1 DUF4114 domain-containing protein [Plectonema cf. radiosum LEGE 06105]
MSDNILNQDTNLPGAAVLLTSEQSPNPITGQLDKPWDEAVTGLGVPVLPHDIEDIEIEKKVDNGSLSYSIQEPYSQTKEDNYDFLLSVDSYQDGLLVGNLDSTNLTFSSNSNLTVSRADSSSPILYFPTNTVDTNSVFPQQVSAPVVGQLLGDTIIVPGRVGERTTLRFKWTEREAAYNNEVGVFVVDELGRVDGIAPGESGYAQAAITSASRQIIFSSGEGAGAQRELTFNAEERLGFYIIQNNTTDQWLLLNPENNLEKGLLAFFSIENVNPDKFDHVFTQTPSNAIVQFFWEDLTGGGNKDFNDVVFTISESRKALGIPGQVGQKVTTKFTWTDREAAYNNELGLFVVDDATGRIGNLLPTDPGYAQAALNNGSRQIIFASSETEGAVKNLELPSGKYIGFYLIQNSTTEHFLRQNPENKSGNGPSAFFLFPGANPDQFDHVVELPPDQFAWEDLTGGGDKDFDDLVFRYEFGSANGDENPEPDRNSPVIVSGLIRDTAPGGFTNIDKITSDPSIAGRVTDKNPITEFRAGINNAPTVNILDALQADGSFNLSPERLNQIFGANLTDGSYTVNLQAKDNFGNASSVIGVTFTLDTQIQTPIIDLAADNDTGISNIDNITRDRTPTITGNTENGAIVQLYNGSTLLGETTANSTGIWQITTGELSDGTQNFTAIATDIAGNVSSPSLPLNVVIDTVNPVINLTDPIDTTPLQTGARLMGNVDGTGSDIAAVSYRFDNLPEIPLVFNAGGEFDQVIDFTGIDNGDRTLAITTTDIAGNSTINQFNVNVGGGGTVENNAPEIISQPETDYIILRNSNTQIKGIALGTTQAGLAEIQGQAFLDFDRNGLRSKEAGLDGFVVELVNSTTGEIIGTQITRSFDVNGDGKVDPFTEQGLYKFTNLQAGSYQVRQIFQDDWSLTLPASSTYNLTLNGGERRKEINFGNAQNYVYEVLGIDADNDTLTYSLVSAPPGATIDSQTGKLIWTPPATGEYAFKIKVADGKGGEDIQEYKLNVFDPNRLPSISSNPIGNATVGENYTYQIIADNPDLDGLNFQLNQAPQGMTISPDGLIQWTPQGNQIGAQQVKLLVKDDRGGEVEQVFTILTQGIPANPQPSGNYAPVITSNFVGDAIVSQQYIYDIDAVDADGDTLSYSLVNAPQNMVIDPRSGVITWNTSSQTLGTYNVTVQVKDNREGIDNQTFSVNLTNSAPGTIEGFKFNDLNANGIWDIGFTPTTGSPANATLTGNSVLLENNTTRLEVKGGLANNGLVPFDGYFRYTDTASNEEVTWSIDPVLRFSDGITTVLSNSSSGGFGSPNVIGDGVVRSTSTTNGIVVQADTTLIGTNARTTFTFTGNQLDGTTFIFYAENDIFSFSDDTAAFTGSIAGNDLALFMYDTAAGGLSVRMTTETGPGSKLISFGSGTWTGFGQALEQGNLSVLSSNGSNFVKTGDIGNAFAFELTGSSASLVIN